jgi:hypothetical protein
MTGRLEMTNLSPQPADRSRDHLRRPQRRRLIAALAIGILCLLPFALILAFEIGVRIVIWAQHGIPGHSYGIYEGHPTLGGILAPSSYNASGNVINGQRFQRLSATPERKPPGTVRAILYGGSTSFGPGLPTGLNWPSRLEEAAAADGHKLEILNAADVSWTLHHALVRSPGDLARFKPDYVIFYEGYNEESNYHGLVESGVDDFAARVRAGETGIFDTNLAQCFWLYRNSVLFKLYRRNPAVASVGFEHDVDRPGEPTAPDPVLLEHFTRTLARAIDAWRASGAKVVYVIQAVGNGEKFRRRRIAFSRVGADVARRHGALVVDAQDIVGAYKGDLDALFTESHIHWTEAGSKLMGRFVYEQVGALDGWTAVR